VTSHSAFTYLAERYGFEQHGITGISPEAEPSAAGLAAIAQLVRDHGVSTIYQETLVEPHFAQTVAATTGATVATLDPIEGITDASAGKDYFEVMRSNLATLKQGQDCS
jgi:zinc transport system substrate-binding protein